MSWAGKSYFTKKLLRRKLKCRHFMVLFYEVKLGLNTMGKQTNKADSYFPNLLLHKSLPVALYALKIPQIFSRNETNLLLFDKNLH